MNPSTTSLLLLFLLLMTNNIVVACFTPTSIKSVENLSTPRFWACCGQNFCDNVLSSFFRTIHCPENGFSQLLLRRGNLCIFDIHPYLMPGQKTIYIHANEILFWIHIHAASRSGRTFVSSFQLDFRTRIRFTVAWRSGRVLIKSLSMLLSSKT